MTANPAPSIFKQPASERCFRCLQYVAMTDSPALDIWYALSKCSVSRSLRHDESALMPASVTFSEPDRLSVDRREGIP